MDHNGAGNNEPLLARLAGALLLSTVSLGVVSGQC